jgi:hypothetical protein
VITHDEAQELLGAYALDAVDDDERAAVEDHLRDCPRCRAEVAEHRETAALLAHASTDAPEALWDRIAGSIDRPADVVPLAPLRLSARRRRPIPEIVAGIAAALVIGVLGLHVRSQDRRIDHLMAATTIPDGRVVELTGTGEAVPVVLTGDRAYLLGAALRDLPDDRTYQLWGKSGDELVSVAVLGHDPGVVVFDASDYAALAITEERAGGVVKSQNPPVAAAALA